jgi:hypothetical protein
MAKVNQTIQPLPDRVLLILLVLPWWLAQRQVAWPQVAPVGPVGPLVHEWPVHERPTWPVPELALQAQPTWQASWPGQQPAWLPGPASPVSTRMESA